MQIGDRLCSSTPRANAAGLIRAAGGPSRIQTSIAEKQAARHAHPGTARRRQSSCAASLFPATGQPPRAFCPQRLTPLGQRATLVGQAPHWTQLQRDRRDVTCQTSTAIGRAGADDPDMDVSVAGSIDSAIVRKTLPPLQAVAAYLGAVYRFSRPHTIIGTAISVCSVSALALGGDYYGGAAAVGLIQALVPALLMNIAIVGLNQLTDVEIDRVNKPYLPLASGELTMQQGRTIVATCGVAALAAGAVIGSAALFATLAGSALLGIVYSTDLPGMRWKRSPVLAAACILAVRAVMVQLGFYYHMRQAVGAAQVAMTRPLAFALSFMLFVSIVIALFKDIPDIKGDRLAGIFTLSVRVGAPQVFWTCIWLLEAAYAGAVVFGLTSPVLWSKVATVVTHTFMGVILYLRAAKTDLTSSKSIYDCYMFVWKLFYAEYGIMLLLR